MHGKFSDKFRSRNAPPPTAKGAEQPKPTKRRARRLMGAPLEFVADVCRLTEGRSTLVVALYIYRRWHVCGSRTVTLPSRELVELGIDRSCKRKALVKLQQAGLIQVDSTSGRTAEVTLIWV